MSPGGCNSIADVNARESHIVRIANLECPVDVGIIRRSVISASDTVIGVSAELVSLLIGGVAHLEAEHPCTDEIDPLDDLPEVCRRLGVRLELLSIFVRCQTEAIRIDDAS